MTSSTASPPPGYDAAALSAAATARSIPMLPPPPPRKPPGMPPGQPIEEPARPIAVADRATMTAAATAATPAISRLRWPISLSLQGPAGLLELLLRDLTARQPPAQHVQRLVAAAPRPDDGARHEDDQRR